ncbi:sensor histidine kinase [Pedobacter arcticus]|uniref:sensor histidine kinase n=1 Tax=Pedobacter arcticus TaxID=752140 RepID=UPI0003071B2A|nr:HAMP domain-containing sensor histidine kinase [Pedobacter arcticus]
MLLLRATDDALINRLALIPEQLKEIKTPDDLDLWKKLDKNITISFFDLSRFEEKPFTTKVLNSETKEVENYRYLQKQIKIFGVNHTVTIKTSLTNKETVLRNIIIVQLFILVIILIGFLIVNRRVNAKIWKPFNKTLDALKQQEANEEISHEGEEEEAENIEIDELNDLNADIKNLLQQKNTAYQLQKEFTENAAHELQTPIAIIKSKLDLLIQDKDLNSNQSLLIDQIYHVLQRLTDLNKNLLLLSKIENQQFELKDKVDCIKTVSTVVASLNFFAEAKYQQLLFPRPEAKVFKGNQVLIDQMIQNLTINAIQYSPKGSIVNILLTERSLSFVNEGPKLDFSEEKLFSRFSKTIEKDQKGNGLGLAISNKIANAHGFSINYEYINAKHHFSVSFKQPNEVQKADSV